MKKFKQIAEQHREKGRFRPTIPRNVSNVAAASPRPSSDSADVRLKEASAAAIAAATAISKKKSGNYDKEGMRVKPYKNPEHPNRKSNEQRRKEMNEQLDKPMRSVEEIAKKHGTTEDFIRKQLEQGIKVEKEHTDEESTARKIALDHLYEKPNYYTKLKQYVEYLDQQDPAELKGTSSGALTLLDKPSKEPMKTYKQFQKEEVDTPPIHVRSMYTRHYAKHGGTISKAKEASAKAYDAVEKMHGKEMRDKLQAFHRKNMSEETEQIDEVSKETLNKYVSKAIKQHPANPEHDPKNKKILQRVVGLRKATSRLYKEEQLEEGRPSQQHPLEGHEYHKKTDAELVHIAKDAHKAAEAMKGHNTQAENKYRDQANDSATIRYFRQKSGMPDWYKKKYGHVKEEVEQIDEVSDTTLSSYTQKAKVSADKLESEKKFGKALKRRVGVLSAVSKMTGRAGEKIGKLAKEETEQLDEISAQAHKEYQAAARKDVAALAKHTGGEYGDITKNIMQRRIKGLSTSTALQARDRMAKIRKEEVEQIDEKNVPTSPEKWAQAKAQAKAKFDVYPSAYANGWAAKKYKEMGGDWKSVSEAKEEPPFKPTKTKEKVIPGKYGKGYSTARHLARMAMQKQAEKTKKPIKEESKKAKIVKDVMKKKTSEDAFQKDPELSNTLTKNV